MRDLAARPGVSDKWGGVGGDVAASAVPSHKYGGLYSVKQLFRIFWT